MVGSGLDLDVKPFGPSAVSGAAPPGGEKKNTFVFS